MKVKELIGKSIKEVDAWIAENFGDIKVDKEVDSNGDVSYWVGGYWSDDALEIDFIDGIVDCCDYMGAWE